MRFSFISGVRNDLLQEIADNTDTLEALITTLNAQVKSPFNYTTPNIITMSQNFVAMQHAATSRDSYTVPANKRAFLCGVAGSIYATASPSAVSSSNLYFELTPNSGTTSQFFFVSAPLAAIGAKLQNNMTCGIDLVAGDKIEVKTGDGSTSSLVQYNFSCLLLEYDA